MTPRPSRRPVDVLFDLARRLGDALEPSAVASVLVDEVVEAVGASQCVAYEVDPLSDELVLVAHAGLEPGAELRLARIPRTTELPLVRTINAGEPAFYSTLAELVAAFPHLEGTLVVPFHAVAAMSFRARGRVVGGLAFSFPDERAFEAEERTFFGAVADICGQALERARLFDSERRARAAAEQAAEQTRTLELVARRLSAAIRAEEVATALLVDAASAIHADTGGIWLADETQTTLRRVGHVGFTGHLEEGTRSFPIPGNAPVAIAFSTESALWLEDRDSYNARFPESIARVEAGRGRTQLAAACVPLRVRERMLGTLAFGFERARVFTDADRTFLLLLAQHCAQALDRSRLFQSEARARKAAEEALERARAADQRKDEFLAMLGHELRNPLAPIATAVQLMKMRGTGVDERARDVIDRQVQHMSRLLDDLMDVSRITQGRIELHKKRVDVATILRDAVEQAKPLLDRKGQEVQVELRSGDLVVWGDAARLGQVVVNLVANASKYSAARPIRVWTERVGDTARIGVTDEGIGISADLLPHVFEVFVQAPQAIARSRGGLGLGLAIVKKLVEMHDGRVEARSGGEDAGSEFVIELPLAGASSAPREVPTTPPVSPRAARPLRVLVVDDNVDAAELVVEALSLAGYEAVAAFDGPSALEEVERFRPEVMVLDIGLPLMSGYEVAERLAGSPTRPRTIIALTGYGQPADRERALEHGFDQHFVKPLELAALLAYLRDVTVPASPA